MITSNYNEILLNDTNEEIENYEHWERSRKDGDYHVPPQIMGNYVYKEQPKPSIPTGKIINFSITISIGCLILGHILGKLI